MKKALFFKNQKIAVIVLACALWISLLLSLTANVNATTTEVSGFSYEGLTASLEYTEGLASASGSGSSVTVTTKAEEKNDPTSDTCGGTTNHYTYIAKSSTLKISNTSGSALKITYTIATGSGHKAGSVNPSVGQNLTATVPAGNDLSITFTSGSNSTSSTSQNTDGYNAVYTVTIISTQVETVNVDVTFAAVSAVNGVTPGSYTAKTGSTTLNLGQTYNNSIDTQYTLTAATNPNYVFNGWYVNDALFSTANPLTTGFGNPQNTVEARFSEDPLYSASALSGAGASEAKSDYVEINSAYYHKDAGNSWRSETGDPSVKDSVVTVRFPDSPWSVSGSTVISSTSGTATGDTHTGALQQSIANVHIYSDVIRVRALKDCSISFTDTITGSNLSTKNFYYYVASSALSGNVGNTVKSSGVENASGTSAQVSLSQGQYLYIVAYGYGTKTSYSGNASLAYSFTSTISNFTIQPLNTRYAVNATFQDNTGIALGAGKLKIGDTTYTIGTDGKPTTTFDAVAGASVTLSVATVPSNYVLVGWKDVTAGTTSYTKTYSFTLNEAHEVQVLFAPVMTITMGSGGYANATYQYKNLSGSTVVANGQYVARNADATKFYATLSEAFADPASVVVLLAGDTFNGDFTVPSGKTLAIPFGMDDAASTTPIELETSSSISGYYASVTFNGNVTVDGSLLVSAKQAGANQGRPGGYIGRLTLSDSSRLTVNGNFYAFGYISGGSIDVGSAAKVYEFAEIKDMRNFTAVFNIYKDRDTYKTFLFNEFFIKNIESPTTYRSGSSLTAYIGVKIAGTDYVTTAYITVIGKTTSAMFNLTSGSMTKSYDRANDQTMLIINEGGTAQTGVCSFSMEVSVAGITQTVNVVTSDYFVPLCHGFGVVVNGNFTFNDRFKFLPGSTLTVGKTGTLTIASGAELAIYRMNDYDTRSTGSGDTAQGFCPGGYPVNASYFPSISYPFKRTTATTGSAKVHVDGTVNVLGSLYVTDQLSNATNYDNGYNNLTGTGKIILNSAQQSSSTLYEATQVSSSNDITWATVALSSIKGLPYEATEDLPDKYFAFAKNTYYGYVNDSGLYAWSTELPKILTYNANGGTAGTMDAVSLYPGKTVALADCGFTWGNYKFTGWNTQDDGLGTMYQAGDSITLSDDVTLYAIWEKNFTVTWKDADGTVLETDEKVPENTTPTYDGTTPTKAEDTDYIYTFSGWSPEIAPVTDDVTYTATYSKLAKNVALVHSDNSITYYESVNEAVEAAANGETVRLLKDSTENVTIAAGKNIILDLNGNSITVSSGTAITNIGTLSIIGTGMVSSSKIYGLDNQGTISVIGSGTFSGATAGLNVASGAVVNSITGGTFTGNHALQVSGTVDTITGGTFTGTSGTGTAAGLYLQPGGKVNTISGGNFTGAIGLLFNSTGEATVGTISGGTFEGTMIGMQVNTYSVVTEVSGGTFISTSANVENNSYAIQNASSTPLKMTATGSVSDGTYVGPLFKVNAGTRKGTLNDPDDKFSYPDAMTLSSQANADGYFYIAPKTIYSITVTWDELSYTYQPAVYKWDGASMKYQVEQAAFWKPTVENAGVKVENTGNGENYGAVKADIAFTANATFTWAHVEFTINGTSYTDSAVLSQNLGCGETASVIIQLTGMPTSTDALTSTAIGAIQLTLSPYPPVS